MSQRLRPKVQQSWRITWLKRRCWLKRGKEELKRIEEKLKRRIEEKQRKIKENRLCWIIFQAAQRSLIVLIRVHKGQRRELKRSLAREFRAKPAFRTNATNTGATKLQRFHFCTSGANYSSQVAHYWLIVFHSNWWHVSERTTQKELITGTIFSANYSFCTSYTTKK